MCPHHLPYDYIVHAEDIVKNNQSIIITMTTDDGISDTATAIRFSYRIKELNGDSEIILFKSGQHCGDVSFDEMNKILTRDFE